MIKISLPSTECGLNHQALAIANKSKELTYNDFVGVCVIQKGITGNIPASTRGPLVLILCEFFFHTFFSPLFFLEFLWSHPRSFAWFYSQGIQIYLTPAFFSLGISCVKWRFFTANLCRKIRSMNTQVLKQLQVTHHDANERFRLSAQEYPFFSHQNLHGKDHCKALQATLGWWDHPRMP